MWVDPEQDENQQQTPNSLNNPSIGAGAGSEAQIQSSSATTGTPSSISPASEAPTQQFGTIQDYFKGNQSQGEKLGEQFTTKLADTQQKQKDTIGQAASQTQGEIAANTIDYNPGIVSEALADPTKITGAQDKLGSFQKQWNAAYKGPESFESTEQYGQAANAVNQAKEKQAQVESTGGRQQLLQDEFGVYGQGNKGLDEALLQQSSYFPKVQEQGKQFGTIQDYLGQQAGTVNTKAQQAKDTTNAAKAKTQDAFANSLTNFQTDLTGRTTAAQAKAADVLKKYQQDLKYSPGTAKLDLEESGVDPATTKTIVEYLNAFNKQYGISPDVSSAYIGNPNVDINPSTVASKEDYAKAAALGQLTGKDYSGVLSPNDASKAGTGILQQNAFKSGDLKNYLKQGLDIQDKTFLARPVNIGNDLRDMSDPKLATEYVQKYIDAVTRQGQTLKRNPILKDLRNQAQNAYSQYRNMGRSDVADAMNIIATKLSFV